MTLPPPGYLFVRTSSKAVGAWKKAMFFAFADNPMSLDSLELVHKKGTKKNARKGKVTSREITTATNGKTDYEAANEGLFRAMAIAAVSGRGILAAYGAKYTELPVALIDVRDIVDVTLTPKLSSKKRHAFTIHTASKELVLAARSEGEVECWVHALQHHVRRSKKFDVEATDEFKVVYNMLATKADFSSCVLSVKEQTISENVSTDDLKVAGIEEKEFEAIFGIATIESTKPEAEFTKEVAEPAKPEEVVTKETAADVNMSVKQTEVAVEESAEKITVEAGADRIPVEAANPESEFTAVEESADKITVEAGADRIPVEAANPESEFTAVEESADKITVEAGADIFPMEAANPESECTKDVEANVEAPSVGSEDAAPPATTKVQSNEVEEEVSLSAEAELPSQTKLFARISSMFRRKIIKPDGGAGARKDVEDRDLEAAVGEERAVTESSLAEPAAGVSEPAGEEMVVGTGAAARISLETVEVAKTPTSEPGSPAGGIPARGQKGLFRLYVPFWVRRTPSMSSTAVPSGC